jgi:Na+/melibiose symporter-like transporter
MGAIKRAQDFFEEMKLYWNQPRPGEYVPYKEIIMLSVGWMALYMSISWSIGFGVGNHFTGMTLGMTNKQLLIMSYICQAIGYAVTPFNAWLVDNLRSSKGKYRVYIQLAIPSTILTVLSLWLPYEQVRDYRQPYTQYVMIFMLFLMGQVQGYVQGWFTTGVVNMVHVITPNTQERTKIMSITSVVYSAGYTINNLYYPVMVDVLTDHGDKYNMRYFRGTYTPVALLAPLVLLAYYGTRERLILPKSRITKMSFANSMRAVAGNKIFWIKCADGWNDFLEGAKGNVWDWMVYRAHIMKSTTYGLLNTVSHNASFWAMLLSPWFIKRFGKKNIKIFKNTLQIFLIASIFLFYKNKFAAIGLFIVTTIDRFIDCGNVIDSAIESDMRDNQQYLIGERIDGAFGFVSSYMGSVIGAVTGLFIPYVYKKKGFDGSDYSVLDVYKNYNENLPLSQQTKNPDCVLFSLMDTLLVISVIGAAIDVLPWFAYDITETGQKGMIRVVRIRTIIEDRTLKHSDDASYIEGSEAIISARKFYGLEKLPKPTKDALIAARALPTATKEQKNIRQDAIKAAKQEFEDVREYNENVEIAEFVMHELLRFKNDFGQKQLEVSKLIASGGLNGFFNYAEEAITLATDLPITDIREERTWRKQEIRNARALIKSKKLSAKHYPNGIVEFDPQTYDDAFDMPDETKEQAKLRRAAMRAANKEKNLYAAVTAPYLSALRTIELSEGYDNLDELISDYDDIIGKRNERHEKEHAEIMRIAQEREIDRQRKISEKKMGKK